MYSLSEVFTPYSQGFREEMSRLFERTMSCWEEHVVSDTMSYYARNAMIWQTSLGMLLVRS